MARVSGGVTRILSDAADPRFAGGLITPAQLNNNGVAAYYAGDGVIGRGVNLYRDVNGQAMPLLNGSGLRALQMAYAETPSINERGDIFFIGRSDDLLSFAPMLVRYTNGQVTTLGTNGGVAPQINNNGAIAFYGGSDSRLGIYAGPDPTDSVIRTGDSLFGSVVRSVGLPIGPGRYLNDRGQIAFAYQLENGVMGIAVATPAGSSGSPRPALDPSRAAVSSFLGKAGFSSNAYLEIYGTNLSATTRTW